MFLQDRSKLSTFKTEFWITKGKHFNSHLTCVKALYLPFLNPLRGAPVQSDWNTHKYIESGKEIGTTFHE